jgi:hypothetical protein
MRLLRLVLIVMVDPARDWYCCHCGGRQATHNLTPRLPELLRDGALVACEGAELLLCLDKKDRAAFADKLRQLAREAGLDPAAAAAAAAAWRLPKLHTGVALPLHVFAYGRAAAEGIAAAARAEAAAAAAAAPAATDNTKADASAAGDGGEEPEPEPAAAAGSLEETLAGSAWDAEPGGRPTGPGPAGPDGDGGGGGEVGDWRWRRLAGAPRALFGLVYARCPLSVRVLCCIPAHPIFFARAPGRRLAAARRAALARTVG